MVTMVVMVVQVGVTSADVGCHVITGSFSMATIPWRPGIVVVNSSIDVVQVAPQGTKKDVGFSIGGSVMNFLSDVVCKKRVVPFLKSV